MNWLWERRRGLLTLGVAAVGTYFAGRFALRKFFEMQEAGGRTRLAKENIRKRFEKNQADCTFTVAALVPALREQLMTMLNAEELAERLKQQRSDGDEAAKREKIATWEEMKVLSFTRTFTSLYAVALLSVLVRIQINLIGRHTYMDSVAAGELRREHGEDAEARKTLSGEVERAYMTFSWHLLNTGLAQLAQVVRPIVTGVVGGISLKRQLSAEDVAGIVRDVRARTDAALLEPSAGMLARCLFPTPDQDLAVLRHGLEDESEFETAALVSSLSLRRLLDETRDYLSSPDLGQVVHSLMDVACELFLRDLSAPFMPELPADGAKITEITGVGATLPMPKVIPVVSRQVNSILAAAQNTYLLGMSANEDLEALGAVVFSALNDAD